MLRRKVHSYFFCFKWLRLLNFARTDKLTACIRNRLQGGRQRDRSSIPDSSLKLFSSSLHASSPGADPASYPVITKTISRGVEQPEGEAEITLLSMGNLLRGQ